MVQVRRRIQYPTSILHIIISLILMNWAINTIYTKEFEFIRYGTTYSYFKGNHVIYLGIFMLIGGLLESYYYLKCNKEYVFSVLKSNPRYFLIFALWLLFIFFPIYFDMLGQDAFVLFLIVIIVNIVTLVMFNRAVPAETIPS